MRQIVACRTRASYDTENHLQGLAALVLFARFVDGPGVRPRSVGLTRDTGDNELLSSSEP